MYACVHVCVCAACVCACVYVCVCARVCVGGGRKERGMRGGEKVRDRGEKGEGERGRGREIVLPLVLDIQVFP